MIGLADDRSCSKIGDGVKICGLLQRKEEESDRKCENRSNRNTSSHHFMYNKNFKMIAWPIDFCDLFKTEIEMILHTHINNELGNNRSTYCLAKSAMGNKPTSFTIC